MTWDLHLPLVITTAVAVVALVSLAVISWWLRWPTARVLGAAVLTLPVWFAAVLLVVLPVVSHMESGDSRYADFDAINDIRIEWCMPRDATDITVNRPFGNGYCARFRISQQPLTTWHNRVWNNHGRHTKRPEGDMTTSANIDATDWPFAEFGWSMPTDLVVYQGPVATSGAQYRILFSEQQELGFLSCKTF